MKKGSFSTFILVLILIFGLSLLLYPTFSDYWNSLHQSRAIATYSEKVAVLDNDVYDSMWADAKQFNADILKRDNVYRMSDEDMAAYHALLNPNDDGILGYIEIPLIKVRLPIYHGVDEMILQIAVGHIEWTSLPTGGKDTHCVLSGHRGVPSAKLFSDLDMLNPGDLFMLHILDELMTYEVDQILVVEPDDVDALHIEEGKDLCTLVTCTPYGVNSHRLLIRGHRVENLEQTVAVRVTADAVQVDPLVVAPIIAIPLLLLFLFIIWIQDTGRKRKS